MTPAPTLQELIDGVRADSPGGEALLQLSQASKTVGDLEQVSDALSATSLTNAAAADIHGLRSAVLSV